MSVVSAYNSNGDYKALGTVETLNVLLEHRKILSECIKEMDAAGVSYIPEYSIFTRVKTYTQDVKSDTRRRINIAFSSTNLLQAHIVMDIDNSQGDKRLYFQESVLAVVRLCDVSLFKKLTDVQLKTHLQILNTAHTSMVSGQYNFSDDDDDFAEFIDNLFLHLGKLLSDVRQNIVKMQSLSKDLEALTSSSVKSSLDSRQYIEAKKEWLQQIVKLYERHIMPLLLFLNPDTTYQDLDGLHAVLSKIRDALYAHNKDQIANNIQSYTLSFLNYYQPIEATANAINRFIHKERSSIKRFNAIEYFYQHKLIPELQSTLSDNLNKRRMGSDAIIQTSYSPNIRAFQRPIGYGFNDSPSYYKNLFNELEARTKDALNLNRLLGTLGKASANRHALQQMQRHTRLIEILKQVSLRETDDLINMLHMRLQDQFDGYHLYDLISSVGFMKTANSEYSLKTTNRFAEASHSIPPLETVDFENDIGAERHSTTHSSDALVHETFRYRKVRCIFNGSNAGNELSREVSGDESESISKPSKAFGANNE
jgi:hypothetical protein